MVSALSLLACALLGGEAAAATARVRWLASGGDPVSRYDVYVRTSGAPYGAPAWSGNPAPAGDGALEASVPFAPAPSGASYFAVVAVSDAGESSLSRELSLGTPIPCRVDSCSAKTTCDFGTVPDGTLCDVGASDPCSAVCVAGTCGTTAGTDGLASEVALDRLRLAERASGIKLSVKGKFATEAELDPTATGAVLELRASDGRVVYAASIGAAAFSADRNGKRFGFSRSRAADPAWNGLTRFFFRRSGPRWIVTAEAKTSALAAAAAEPALTLVVRLGGVCMRYVGAQCEQDPPLSVCR